jgi:hypothetical protein
MSNSAVPGGQPPGPPARPDPPSLKSGSGNQAVSPGPNAKIIPLQPGIARPTGERRALMRDAVLQVVGHLVIETVPPGNRSPLFDQAADLLDQAGWGLDELFEASRDGPARDELLRRLGLLET